MAKHFTFTGRFQLTGEMKKAYNDDGFCIVKNFFDSGELAQMMKTVSHPDGILKESFTTEEAGEKKLTRIVWTHPGSDVTGMVARAEKVVNTCEEFLGGEVYHYHTKMLLKNPHVGGATLWHQDYGYWYKQNLFPDLITVWIPLDRATRKNSCLQVLQGSHKCGRITHAPGGATMQVTCDLDRIEAIKKTCPHVYCEMEPGDVLFLHCNTIHMSSPNESDMRRWALICCYNKATNDSFVPHHHASYTKLEKVADSVIKECRNYTDFSGKVFVNPKVNEKIRETMNNPTVELHTASV